MESRWTASWFARPAGVAAPDAGVSRLLARQRRRQEPGGDRWPTTANSRSWKPSIRLARMRSSAAWASRSWKPPPAGSSAPCPSRATRSHTACCTAAPPAYWPRRWARLGSALHAGPDRITVGIEISATHHRGAADGEVTGVATLLHGGRTLTTYEIVITDELGRRICTSRLSCLLRDAVPGGAQARLPGRPRARNQAFRSLAPSSRCAAGVPSKPEIWPHPVLAPRVFTLGHLRGAPA